jgi:hypothetical protein
MPGSVPVIAPGCCAAGLRPDGRDCFLADLCEEHLGTPNTELIDCFAALRPRYRTSIVSNGVVDDHEVPVEGARAIGMTAVLHTDTTRTITELEALLTR